MTRAERIRLFALERGGLLAFITLVLYIWLAPTVVIDGDNAEMATLSVTGGAAHPSGYPLYILWLRAMAWLPGESPAHTAAIATAILAASTNLVLHAACRSWGARPFAATTAVVLFATGPVILRLSTEAEVFVLNNLVVASVLWIAAPEGPLRATRRACVLGLVAGLGLANHLTCVLIAPLGIYGVVCGVRESGRAPISIGAALGAFLAGLAPYLYLLVAPDAPMSWGVVRDLDGLVGMVTRRDYGGATAFRTAAVHVPATKSVVALLATIGRAWLWAPAVGGVVVLGVRSIRGDARIAHGLLALSFLIAGPILVVRFNVPPEGLGLYVCQRFHVLPALLLTIPIAEAIDLVHVRRTQLACAVVATLGVAAAMAPSRPYLSRVQSPAVETSARNMLRSLPPDSMIVHAQDELHAVPAYVQTALGERPDVVVVTWSLVSLGWYQQRIAARGVPVDASKLRMIDRALAAGRPVFVDRLQRDVIEAFPTYPWGILLRVLPRGTRIPSPREIYDLNAQLYRQFVLAYSRPGPDDEFATEVHRRYAGTWEIIGKALERVGEHELSESAFARAHDLGPR